jgi:hypothetical protein
VAFPKGIREWEGVGIVDNNVYYGVYFKREKEIWGTHRAERGYERGRFVLKISGTETDSLENYKRWEREGIWYKDE